jgi:hypothetical protein
LLLSGWILAAAAFIGVLLSLVPVYETSRRRHLMLQEVVEHETEPVVPERPLASGAR